ncbi:MAG: TolC family protein [Gemmatimonadetes bacterium]|nr:TolC family protein [Gemmatimonadota bacterium]
MNSTSSTIAGLLLVALCAPVQAQEAGRITLAEALDLFARNNLELRLARAEAAEAAGIALQAAAFSNPSIVLTHEPLSNDGVTYSESYVHLSQRLEWPGTRAARRSATTLAASAALARVAADSLRIAFAVKRAYVEAAHSESQVMLLARVVAVFREAEGRAVVRLAEGDLSRYDVQRIRVERLRYEGGLAQAELDGDAARRALALLITPETDPSVAPERLPATGPPALETTPVVALAFARRPELRAATAAVEGATAGVAAARGERIPDLTLTGGFKRQSDGFTGAYVGVSLPVPFWDRRRGTGEAASARLAGSESRLSLTRRQIENDVQRAMDTYRSLLARSALLDDAPGDGAGDLLDIAQVAWAEGEMDLLGLLDAAAALRDAQALEARLRADLWIAYHDVERAVGGFDTPANDTENER